MRQSAFPVPFHYLQPERLVTQPTTPGYLLTRAAALLTQHLHRILALNKFFEFDPNQVRSVQRVTYLSGLLGHGEGAQSDPIVQVVEQD